MDEQELFRRARMVIAQKIREVALRDGVTPRRTGELRDSIITEDDEQNAYVIAGRGRAPYALYVHGGTGVHGKFKKRIKPKTKGGLAFFIGGQQIVRKSVAGQRANPFLTNAATLASQEGWSAAASLLTQGVALRLVTELKKK